MTDRLLAFYGDDFSGSADVMETLAAAGVPTVLFLAPPSPAQLAMFPEARAVGVAGVSRSLPAAAMESELRPAFEALRPLARLVHYKVCSTFDSSPEIGSIGRAIDVGRSVLGSGYVPLVVAAPALGRYCAFGNLFARSGPLGPAHRLDRHPTMARHPVTPMDEADLTRVLARQSAARVGLLDLVSLGRDAARRRRELLREGAEVVLFDAVTDADLIGVGGLIWSDVGAGLANFAVGSSGLQSALVAHWRRIGDLDESPSPAGPRPADRILVVSGSCSPVTASQIEAAGRAGFGLVPIEPEDWVAGDPSAALRRASAVLRDGRSAVVHAATGPDDPRIALARRLLDARGLAGDRDARLGDALAEVVRAAVGTLGVGRVVFAGGDTSGYVTRWLGVEALEFVAPIAPGTPLCRVVAGAPQMLGVDMAFKGGQVGGADFFVRACHGAVAAHRKGVGR